MLIESTLETDLATGMKDFENWQVLSRLLKVMMRITPKENSLYITDPLYQNPFSPRQELMGESMISMALNYPDDVLKFLTSHKFHQDKSIIE